MLYVAAKKFILILALVHVAVGKTPSLSFNDLFRSFPMQLNEVTGETLINRIKDITKSFSELGRMCFASVDCIGISRGVECSSDHTCQCDSNHIKMNATHCLPGALLGFGCETGPQCRLKVPNSTCIRGYCRCYAGYSPYRRSNCLKESILGAICRTDAQCKSVDRNSECKWIVRKVMGRCRCQKGMPRLENRCQDPGYGLGAPCGRSLDCAKHVPGSICVDATEEILSQKISVAVEENGVSTRHRVSSVADNFLQTNRGIISSIFSGVCLCPKGYLAIENNTRCVPVQKDAAISPISLGKSCLTDSQCMASDPHSVCKGNVCDCSMPNSECSPLNNGCFNETFQCVSNGRCISAEFVCNHHAECEDGSDEANCNPGQCSPLAFMCADGTCLQRGKLCDGKLDCADRSDEENCFDYCPKSTYRCHDGLCLPGHSFCNARVNCIDRSDEEDAACVQGTIHVPDCPFRCKNHRCRSTAILCSGKDGCGDASDEEKCSVCSCPKPAL